MKPCECGHIYTYHNEKGCGGTVEFRGVAVRNFKPCGCTRYRPKTDEASLILASEDEQGTAADLITDIALLDTADAHQAKGCDCDFCIGYQIGQKAEMLKAKLAESGSLFTAVVTKEATERIARSCNRHSNCDTEKGLCCRDEGCEDCFGK
jgi:hypothetical protein